MWHCRVLCSVSKNPSRGIVSICSAVSGPHLGLPVAQSWTDWSRSSRTMGLPWGWAESWAGQPAEGEAEGHRGRELWKHPQDTTSKIPVECEGKSLVPQEQGSWGLLLREPVGAPARFTRSHLSPEQNDLILKLLCQPVGPETSRGHFWAFCGFVPALPWCLIRAAATEDMQWGGSCPSRATPFPQVQERAEAAVVIHLPCPLPPCSTFVSLSSLDEPSLIHLDLLLSQTRAGSPGPSTSHTHPAVAAVFSEEMPWRGPVLQCMELEEEHPRDLTPTRRNLELRSFSSCKNLCLNDGMLPHAGVVWDSSGCTWPLSGKAQCGSVGSIPRAGGRDTTGCVLPSVQCHPCLRASAAQSHLPSKPCPQRQRCLS